MKKHYRRIILAAAILAATIGVGLGLNTPPADAAGCTVSSYEWSTTWGCGKDWRYNSNQPGVRIQDKSRNGRAVVVYAYVTNQGWTTLAVHTSSTPKTYTKWYSDTVDYLYVCDGQTLSSSNCLFRHL